MSHLKIRNASKAFAGAKALADVHLDLFPGEVHALMGENGAGKSTLIKILAGVQAADSLDVWHGDQKLELSNAGDSKSAGFRFIHQELNIIPHLSVAENVSLGLEYPKRFWVAVNWFELKRRAEAAFKRLGVSHIDVTQQAARLPTGDRMLMKIAGSLVSDDDGQVQLYVLDEPTAALSDEESEKLFKVIEELKKAGVAVLYVSHRMNEVMRLCDRVTVLKDGENVLTSTIADTSKDEIIFAMTGRDVGETYPKRKTQIGEQVTCRVAGLKTPNIKSVDFTLRSGEILGISGLANAGQSEILQAIMGVEPVTGGEIHIDGCQTPTSPSQAWNRGVAYVPKERRSEGLMLRRSVIENVALPHLSVMYPHEILLKSRAEKSEVARLSEAVRLKSASLDQAVYQLSGGNQQKVLLARWLLTKPQFLILDEPTNGLDPKGIIEMRALIKELNEKQGITIFVSSHLLAEIEKMCTHVGIINDGKMIFQDTVKALKSSKEGKISIEIDTQDIEKSKNILEEKLALKTIIEDNFLIAEIEAKEYISLIIDVLRSSEIDVYQIRIKDNLEDLFLSLTETN